MDIGNLDRCLQVAFILDSATEATDDTLM